MHIHVSGLQTLITVLEVIVVLGALNLLAQKYKSTSTFWASYDSLMNNN